MTAETFVYWLLDTRVDADNTADGDEDNERVRRRRSAQHTPKATMTSSTPTTPPTTADVLELPDGVASLTPLVDAIDKASVTAAVLEGIVVGVGTIAADCAVLDSTMVDNS